MTSEFRLCVLIGVLAVEVGCAYEGTLLFSMSVSNFPLRQVSGTFAGGLYHASREVAAVPDSPILEIYRWWFHNSIGQTGSAIADTLLTSDKLKPENHDGPFEEVEADENRNCLSPARL